LNGVYEQGNVLLAKGIGCKGWIHAASQADTERIFEGSQLALSPRVFNQHWLQTIVKVRQIIDGWRIITTMSGRTAH